MIQKTTHKVESNIAAGHSASYHIDPASTVHISRILRNMYSRPVLAVIRELVTNAVDAHVHAGIKTPVIVKLPTSMSPEFVVTDQGGGLSVENFDRYILGYGSSGEHKRTSNTQIGGFGIGCKCPFAITDTFTYKVWFNGSLRQYIVYLDESDQGKSDMISVTPDPDHPAGIEVTVPVKEADISSFRNEINDAVGFIEFPLKVCGQVGASVNTIWHKDVVPLLSSNKGGPATFAAGLEWSLLKSRDERDGYRAPMWRIVMGGVSYRVPESLLSQLAKAEEGYSLPGGLKFGFTDRSVNVFAPIGSFELAPNREFIVDCRKALHKLNTFINDLYTVVPKHVSELSDKAPTHHDASFLFRGYLEEMGLIPRHNSKETEVPYRGTNKTVRELFSVPIKSIRECGYDLAVLCVQNTRKSGDYLQNALTIEPTLGQKSCMAGVRKYKYRIDGIEELDGHGTTSPALAGMVYFDPYKYRVQKEYPNEPGLIVLHGCPVNYQLGTIAQKMMNGNVDSPEGCPFDADTAGKPNLQGFIWLLPIEGRVQKPVEEVIELFKFAAYKQSNRTFQVYDLSNITHERPKRIKTVGGAKRTNQTRYTKFLEYDHDNSKWVPLSDLPDGITRVFYTPLYRLQMRNNGDTLVRSIQNIIQRAFKLPTAEAKLYGVREQDLDDVLSKLKIAGVESVDASVQGIEDWLKGGLPEMDPKGHMFPAYLHAFYTRGLNYDEVGHMFAHVDGKKTLTLSALHTMIAHIHRTGGTNNSLSNVILSSKFKDLQQLTPIKDALFILNQLMNTIPAGEKGCNWNALYRVFCSDPLLNYAVTGKDFDGLIHNISGKPDGITGKTWDESAAKCLLDTLQPVVAELEKADPLTLLAMKAMVSDSLLSRV